MLRYYEQKGRKIYFAVMLSFIIVFSFAFYAGKFYTLHTAGARSSVITNIDEVQNDKKQITGQFAYVEGEVKIRTHAQDGWRITLS